MRVKPSCSPLLAVIMMHCPRYERLAALLYDGELHGPLRREVRAHVAGCVACTRWLAAIERMQEVLAQDIDEQVEQIDFSRFWEQLEGKLSAPPPSWLVRLRLRWEQWKASQPVGVPLGAAAVAVLLAVIFSVVHFGLRFDALVSTPQPDPSRLMTSNQAQIQSLSAATTVALWNEPTSNAPVIWLADDRDGAVP
ncbi:MAG: zf-HC2 domain-containing protein [Candidatus Binatia bacterium]|nr:zf-HC2 domain-containing protein [Candidatus Binatia bacterium]